LIDPTFRGGLIDVPFNKTLETKGRSDWAKGTLQKDLSLCCLFQRGRCSLHERCHQIHVDTQFMASVRQQNLHVVSCCRRCKDTASLTSSAVSFFATFFNEKVRGITVNTAPSVDKKVDADMLAFTIGLESWLCDEAKGNVSLTVPTRKICRLHLGGRCKYGKDCKYLHLCSQLGEDFLTCPASTHVVSKAPSNPVCVEKTAKPTEAWKRAEATPSKNTFYQPKVVSSPPQNTFFDRVKKDSTPVSHSTSSAETTPDTQALDSPAPLYFTADRFTAPIPAVTAPAERSGSAMFPKSNGSSCLERSVALSGLCFDPALLWDVAEDFASNKKADVFGASCEVMSCAPLSSTCSEAASLPSTRKMSLCAFY